MADVALSAQEANRPAYEVPLVLSFWQRACLSCCAAFCAAVGIGGMFRTSNEGATTVFIGGALVFTVLAILGEMPTRGCFGNLSWDLSRRLLRSSDESVAAAMAQEILEEAEVRSVPSDILLSAQQRAMQASLDYERSALAALDRIARERGWEIRTRDDHVDGVIVDGSAQALIEIKYASPERSSKFVNAWVDQMLAQALRYSDKHGQAPAGALLLTRGLSPRTAARLRETAPQNFNIFAATWAGPQDDEHLAQQLGRILSRGHGPEANE